MACKNITMRKRVGKQYLIHYAGGASFVVRVFGNVLTVYTSKYDPDITANKQVYRANIKKLFVPSSLKPGSRLPKKNIKWKAVERRLRHWFSRKFAAGANWPRWEPCSCWTKCVQISLHRPRCH